MPSPVATASALVRRPAADVFDAFVDPARITAFWLDGTTGPLAPGAEVEWTFMVPGATERVRVTAFEPGRRLAFRWSDGIDVAIGFAASASGSTVVSVEACGFDGAAAAVDATEGFAVVLCDLKLTLETGCSPGLVRDKARLVAQGASDGG